MRTSASSVGSPAMRYARPLDTRSSLLHRKRSASVTAFSSSRRSAICLSATLEMRWIAYAIPAAMIAATTTYPSQVFASKVLREPMTQPAPVSWADPFQERDRAVVRSLRAHQRMEHPGLLGDVQE